MDRFVSDNRIETLPSGRAPEERVLDGRLVILEPVDSERHAQTLYLASHETAEAKEIWSFLPDGPLEDLATFTAWLGAMAVAPDRAVFAFRDKASGRTGGMATYLDIRPSHGSIDVGYIWFAPVLQRTPQATEELFLMLSSAFDELHYRRMQWRAQTPACFQS